METAEFEWKGDVLDNPVSVLSYISNVSASVQSISELEVYNDLTGAKLCRILTMTYKSDENRMFCYKSEVY